MKLFTVDPDGSGLIEIALEAFDQEAKLEDWIEANPSELLGLADETLLPIGRQVGPPTAPWMCYAWM
jgi:hypothetical protein